MVASEVYSQTEWQTSGSNLYNNPNSGYVGIGTGSSINFKLELGDGTESGDRKIGIDGKQVVYLPNQTDFSRSLIIGDGGSNLFRGGGDDDGTSNLILGFDAGKEITTGRSNLFMGAEAGRDITSGRGSVCIGNRAGAGITTGIFNIIIGSNAGRELSNNSENIMIGILAGRLTQADNNVFVGNRSGLSNVSGSSNIFIGFESGYYETGSNKLYIENSNSSSPLIYGEFNNDIVGINGQLGVGTQTPDANAQLHVTGNAIVEGTLYTDGKIWSEEVEVVSSVTWPDYVFENDYSLMTISELEKYINDNGHLPEIPKAEEAEKGIKLGEMNAKLLKKIEELTLYIIQQEKRIQELEEKIGN